MPVYKFHDPRYTDDLLNGSFMLSSLDYFAALPWLTGDEEIGDAGEAGARFIQSKPLVWGPGVAPENAAFLAEQRLVVVSESFGGTIQIEGLNVLRADDPAHIFSMAAGELDELKAAMPAHYGSIIEVFDPVGLAQSMWGEGVSAAGTPVRDLLGEPQVEEVVYGGRTSDLNSTNAPLSGPFRKDEQYKVQREVRIHFPDAQQWVHDRLVVRISEPTRFLRLIQRGEIVSEEAGVEPDLQEASLAALAAQRMGQDQTEVMRRLLWRWRLDRGLRTQFVAPYDGGAGAWAILQDMTGENPWGARNLVQMSC